MATVSVWPWRKNWRNYRGALDLPEKVIPNFMTSPKVLMSSLFPGDVIDLSRRVAKVWFLVNDPYYFRMENDLGLVNPSFCN